MDKPNKDSKSSKLEKGITVTSDSSYFVIDGTLNLPEVANQEFTSGLAQVQVDSESNPPYNYVEPKTVKIMSVFDARLEYTGQVSGKQYVWSKAGSIVPVDAEDSEYLLAKRIGGKLCCGNSLDTNKLFTIAI